MNEMFSVHIQSTELIQEYLFLQQDKNKKVKVKKETHTAAAIYKFAAKRKRWEMDIKSTAVPMRNWPQAQINIIIFSYFCSSASLYEYLAADYIFSQIYKGQRINVDMLIFMIVLGYGKSTFNSCHYYQ